MSALAKAVLAFNDRGVTVHHNGRVWVPEDWWQKWLELARREVSASKQQPVPMPGAEGSR